MQMLIDDLVARRMFVLHVTTSDNVERNKFHIRLFCRSSMQNRKKISRSHHLMSVKEPCVPQSKIFDVESP